MKKGSSAARTAARSWRPAGAAGFQVLHIEQSPHDACYWMAATQGGGLFVSTDCGVTFESNGSLGAGRNVSDIAFDPASANRIAVAGWGVGVAVSEDLGKTWQIAQCGAAVECGVERRFRPRQGRPRLCGRA